MTVLSSYMISYTYILWEYNVYIYMFFLMSKARMSWRVERKQNLIFSFFQLWLFTKKNFFFIFFHSFFFYSGTQHIYVWTKQPTQGYIHTSICMCMQRDTHENKLFFCSLYFRTPKPPTHIGCESVSVRPRMYTGLDSMHGLMDQPFSSNTVNLRFFLFVFLGSFRIVVCPFIIIFMN